jgi:hypothetical protein
VPKEGRTRQVTQRQVGSYLGKAEEFLAAARERTQPRLASPTAPRASSERTRPQFTNPTTLPVL